MIFFVLLLFLPLIEIAGFVAIGSEIGVLNTIFLYIATAVAGGVLIQREGLRTMAEMQAALDRGQMPVRELFDSICVFIAGLFLVLPGFVSDLAAFLLLIPIVRDVLRRHAEGYFVAESASDVIEGEFSRVEDDSPKHLS